MGNWKMRVWWSVKHRAPDIVIEYGLLRCAMPRSGTTLPDKKEDVHRSSDRRIPPIAAMRSAWKGIWSGYAGGEIAELPC